MTRFRPQRSLARELFARLLRTYAMHRDWKSAALSIEMTFGLGWISGNERLALDRWVLGQHIKDNPVRF